MHSAVEIMLEKYNCTRAEEYRNALREIIQEIALSGLYRAGFFDRAAFYGGTALRIFYGLRRFSEDLDFSLLAPDPDFDIQNYCKYVQEELGAFGFEAQVSKKQKNVSANIESAFIKAGTLGNSSSSPVTFPALHHFMAAIILTSWIAKHHKL